MADKDTYANKDIYTAYFIKSGDEIKEIDKNIPLPNGFHKVTIAKGDGIEDNQLFGKTYAVKEGVKLSKDKFPNINAKQSYKDPKWNVGNPWDQVMGKADVTYTASATKIEYTTDQVIPWIPKDPKNPENDKPTTGKDGKEIPANYITVKFTAQKEAGKALGKVTVGAKTGEEVLAKVKPNTDLSKKNDIKATAEKGYGFTVWNPVLGVVTNVNKAFEAKFIKDGSEVGKNDPIPTGWFKVTVKQDATSIAAGTVTEKAYAVAPKDDAKGQTGKLSKNKFPSLTGKEATNYEKPGWYKDAETTATADPSTVEIKANTTFTAKATAQATNDDVIPYLPGEKEPDKGSDGKSIPANYITCLLYTSPSPRDRG